MSAQTDTQRKLAGRARLRDDAVGSLVHSVLAELLRLDAPFTADAAMREADRQLPARLAPSHRQSLRQRTASAALRYQQHFRRADWRLLETEANLEDVRVDLLFLMAGGEICCDEIKTGSAAEGQLAQIRTQAESQLVAGRMLYGAAFTGVRVVLLAADRSVWVDQLSEGTA